MELFENEVPDQDPVNPDEKLCYIFVVDRSGSMSGSRMETTKEALKLFLKSLPPACRFQIVSFGTSHSNLQGNMIEYSDQMKDWAIGQVSQFSASFGGTDIYSPMMSALNSNT